MTVRMWLNWTAQPQRNRLSKRMKKPLSRILSTGRRLFYSAIPAFMNLVSQARKIMFPNQFFIVKNFSN